MRRLKERIMATKKKKKPAKKAAAKKPSAKKPSAKKPVKKVHKKKHKKLPEGTDRPADAGP
jgi:hypothetical protein